MYNIKFNCINILTRVANIYQEDKTLRKAPWPGMLKFLLPVGGRRGGNKASEAHPLEEHPPGCRKAL